MASAEKLRRSSCPMDSQASGGLAARRPAGGVGNNTRSTGRRGIRCFDSPRPCTLSVGDLEITIAGNEAEVRRDGEFVGDDEAEAIVLAELGGWM